MLFAPPCLVLVRLRLILLSSPLNIMSHQLLKTTLGFLLNTHIFRHVLWWLGLIENFVVVGGLDEVHETLFLLFCFLFLLYLKNGEEGGRCYSYCKGGNR